MAKRYLIGVDLGTTTVKAVFLDAQENKVVTTQTEEIFPVKGDNPEYIEYDPNDWWQYTKRILQAGFRAGVNPEEVAGICFGGWTVMSLLVKTDGTPVTNAVHYNDMRHMEVAEEVEALIGSDAVLCNGNYIGMYSGSVKQYWWKKMRPEVFQQGDLVSTEVSWMNFKLTGQWAWNRTEAGFYSQYNTQTREWDEGIIQKLGFPKEMFPRLVDAWEVVGCVTKEAAKEIGLCEGTPVFGGVDDASPVAIATGVIAQGQGYVSAGSAANIAANVTSPISHRTTITYPHCVPGLTMAITVMSSTGLSYKWMRNTFADYEVVLAKESGKDPYDYMNEQAAKVAPGCNGVIFLPYLDGDYTPNNDINARGAFIGMDTYTSKGDMYRATMEGVAYSMLDNIMLIRELGGDIQEIVLTGGIAKGSLWLQIISDVTNCPISLPDETEGAALGSAIVAGVGAKLYPSFQDAIDKVIKIKHRAFVPNPNHHQIYSKYFKVYKDLYAQIKGIFAQMADIRGSIE